MTDYFLHFIANLETVGKKSIRFGIVVVVLWIGALKFFPYEADGIVPFVANSPFMAFFYNHPKDYRSYINKEGELIPANRDWHCTNNTYQFAKWAGRFLNRNRCAGCLQQMGATCQHDWEHPCISVNDWHFVLFDYNTRELGTASR